MSRRPLVLLDCAHNVASARALVQTLTASFPMSANARRILIFAGSRDKDLAGMLEVLAPAFDRIYLTSFQNSTRCATPTQLAALVPADRRTACNQCLTTAEAWRLAAAVARPDDLICATGSIFLAGELRLFC